MKPRIDKTQARSTINEFMLHCPHKVDSMDLPYDVQGTEWRLSAVKAKWYHLFNTITDMLGAKWKCKLYKPIQTRARTY